MAPCITCACMIHPETVLSSFLQAPRRCGYVLSERSSCTMHEMHGACNCRTQRSVTVHIGKSSLQEGRKEGRAEQYGKPIKTMHDREAAAAAAAAQIMPSCEIKAAGLSRAPCIRAKSLDLIGIRLIVDQAAL